MDILGCTEIYWETSTENGDISWGLNITTGYAIILDCDPFPRRGKNLQNPELVGDDRAPETRLESTRVYHFFIVIVFPIHWQLLGYAPCLDRTKNHMATFHDIPIVLLF